MRGSEGTGLSRWALGRGGRGRRPRGRKGRVLGSERKPEEGWALSFNPDIVHFTGEWVVVHLGSSRLSWLGDYLLCAS